MIVVPSTVWAETLNHFRRCGAGRRECVTYWTGPANDPRAVDAVVHPVHAGTAGSYDLDENWLHEFWVGLARTKRSIRVQVHTHAFDAFHSRTDDLWPIVHVPRFLSLVVPHFAMEFSRSGLYLAEIDEDGVWARIDVDERLTGIP